MPPPPVRQRVAGELDRVRNTQRRRMGSWGEGRAGPTLQEIKPSHLGAGGASAPRRRCRRHSRMRSVPHMAPPTPRSSLLHAPRKPHPATLWGGNKKKHISGAHVCNVGSCLRPHGSNQTKKTKHPNHKSKPGPAKKFLCCMALGPSPPSHLVFLTFVQQAP